MDDVGGGSTSHSHRAQFDPTSGPLGEACAGQTRPDLIGGTDTWSREGRITQRRHPQRHTVGWTEDDRWVEFGLGRSRPEVGVCDFVRERGRPPQKSPAQESHRVECQPAWAARIRSASPNLGLSSAVRSISMSICSANPVGSSGVNRYVSSSMVIRKRKMLSRWTLTELRSQETIRRRSDHRRTRSPSNWTVTVRGASPLAADWRIPWYVCISLPPF